MKWTRGTRNDHVVDARRRRTAPMVAGGGVVVAVIVFAAAQLFGLDVSGLFGGGGGSTTSSSTTQDEPATGPDPDAELVDYVRFVMKDIQDTFTAKYEAAGMVYRPTDLVLFTQAIDTGCGRSSSSIGPFYCPADRKAYIDLSFYRDLKARFGAPGDFAQAYVLAHEVGHHLQNLMRIEEDPATLRRGATRNDRSVRLELQADCFAGVWGNAARGKHLLDVGDLEEAIEAATAIGDDRLQRQAGRAVHPETFTHGSSAQRVRWFRVGFDSGKLEACDTFAIAEP